MRADYCRREWQEGDGCQLQKYQPQKNTIETPHLQEQPVVGLPEDGDHREAGEIAEQLRPYPQQGGEQSLSMQIGSRFRKGQLYGEEGEGYREDAIGQGEETIE